MPGKRAKAPKSKQEHKSKEDVAAEMARVASIAKQKTTARLLFPSVEQLPTVYDAQTAFETTSGVIKLAVMKVEEALKVKDLTLDTDKIQDGDIKHAIKAMLELVADEPALEAMNLINQMGSRLPQFLAMRHLKDPMNTISAAEYIAE